METKPENISEARALSDKLQQNLDFLYDAEIHIEQLLFEIYQKVAVFDLNRQETGTIIFNMDNLTPGWKKEDHEWILDPRGKRVTKFSDIISKFINRMISDRPDGDGIRINDEIDAREAFLLAEKFSRAHQLEQLKNFGDGEVVQ